MPAPVNFVQTMQEVPEEISILLVSSSTDDLSSLRNILHHRDWNISHCRTLDDAIRHITAHPTCVIVTESTLPDGSWKDMLQHADSVAETPLVLVTARHADDRLWAEVLNMGGYDVLLKPFDRSEVARVVGMARRCWNGFRRAHTPRPQYASQFA